MVYEVLLGKWRDDQQWETWAITTTVIKSTLLGSAGTTHPGTIEGIVCRIVGWADSGTDYMIVPAIRVIIGNDHCCVFPGGQLLQTIECVREELLLVQW